MKKIYIIVSLLLIAANSSAQPTLNWAKTYGGTNADRARCIVATADGGFVMAGEASSWNGDVVGIHNSFPDFWIVKCDADGTILWQSTLGGFSSETAYDIIQTSDGGFVICGGASSNDGDVIGHHGTSWNDCWIVKLNASGILQWQKTYGGNNDDIAYSIKQTTDGGYIVAGKVGQDFNGTSPVTYGNDDCWVLKLDSNGDMQWNEHYGGFEGDSARDILETPDGGYLMLATTHSTDYNVINSYGPNLVSDIWLVKLTASGAIEWSKCYGGTSFDIASSIEPTLDGGYIICGTSASADGDVTDHQGQYDIWVFKIAADGTLQWTRSLGGTITDSGYNAKPALDGGYLVAGRYGQGVAALVKLDENGYVSWGTQYNPDTTAYHSFYDFALKPDGSIFAVGESHNSSNDYDFLTVKYNYTLAVPQTPDSDFVLYPIPVNDVLHIETGLNIEKAVICDMLGNRKIAAVNENSIELANLASGIYFVELTTSDGKLVRKRFIKN